MEIRRILVPLDGSELAEMALPYAEELAKRLNGEVLLMRAALARVGPGGDPVIAQVRAVTEAETYLAEVEAQLTARGIKAQSVVPYGSPAQEIVDEARIRNTDLIVMSTHGRSGLGRLVSGSVADEVLRKSGVPVLLIKPGAQASLPVDKTLRAGSLFQRAVVALDGSELAESLLPMVETLGAKLGAEVHLFTAIPGVQTTITIAGESFSYLVEENEPAWREADGYLARLEERLKAAGASVKRQIRYGDPAYNIVRYAQEIGAGLIAMATHGRGGLSRWWYGSVAEAILREAPGPILLVRPTIALRLPKEEAGLLAKEGQVPLELHRQEIHLARLALEYLAKSCDQGDPARGKIKELMRKLAAAIPPRR